MPVFDWRTILPLVFAAPFFVFGILNWRQASTRDSAAYLAILSGGTAFSCIYLGAQAELRIYCGVVMGLSMGLAFFARYMLVEREEVTAPAVAQSSRRLIVPAMLYPVFAATWIFFAWGQLTEPPPFSYGMTPFMLGWIPPDWLELYPHALTYAWFAMLGTATLRLEVPQDSVVAASSLRAVSLIYTLMQFFLAVCMLRKAEGITEGQAFAWLGGAFAGIAVLGIFCPDFWQGPATYYALYPMVDASGPHWRYRYFYWNPSERSPAIRTNGGFRVATNWASPVVWLQYLHFLSLMLMTLFIFEP